MKMSLEKKIWIVFGIVSGVAGVLLAWYLVRLSGHQIEGGRWLLVIPILIVGIICVAVIIGLWLYRKRTRISKKEGTATESNPEPAPKRKWSEIGFRIGLVTVLITLLWILVANWASIKDGSTIMFTRRMFWTIIILLTGTSLFFLAINWRKSSKGLAAAIILVVMIRLVVTMWSPAQEPLIKWSANNNPAGKTGSERTAIGSGMPMTIDKEFEGPIGEWSPYQLVVKPNHYYTYEVDGDVDIQVRSEDEPFRDGPGIQQPYRKVNTGEEGMWRFRSATNRKVTATFHYSPK